MRFEYFGSLLDQILSRDNVLRVEYVYVSNDEFNDIRGSAIRENLLDDEADNWITIKCYDFTICLEE